MEEREGEREKEYISCLKSAIFFLLFCFPHRYQESQGYQKSRKSIEPYLVVSPFFYPRYQIFIKVKRDKDRVDPESQNGMPKSLKA